MFTATAYTVDMVPTESHQGTLPSIVEWLSKWFDEHHKYGTLNNQLSATGVYAKAAKNKAGTAWIVVVIAESEKPLS